VVLEFRQPPRGGIAVKGFRSASSRLSFGQFELCLLEEKLFKRGLPVRLENQPLQILAALLEKPGDVVGREELRNRLWPRGTYVDFDEGLNTAIKKLRYALGDSADAPVFIETIPRRGYRFLAPVSVVEAESSVPENGHQSTSLTTADNPRNPAAFSEPDGLGSPPDQKHTPLPWKRGLGLSLIVLLSLLMAAGAGLYRWRTLLRSRASHEAMEIRKLTDTGDIESAAISPDGRYVIYARRVGEKVSLRMRQLGSGGDAEILPLDTVNFVGLAFSPDGNYLYFARSDKDDPGYRYLYVMPALGGPARKLISDVDSPPSFSPDGRQFVFTRGVPTKNQTEVRIANPDGSGDHLLATIEESEAGSQSGASWSPDGRTIAVPVFHLGKKIGSALYAIAVADGKQREFYSADGEVGRPLWFPDGDGILVTLREPDFQRGQMWMIPFPSGRRQRITNDLSNYGLTPDMTADGKNLVVVERTRVSNIWASSAADGSGLQQITFGESAMLEAIEGERGGLVVLGQDELWSMNADGSSRQLLAKLEADRICRSGGFVVASVWKDGLQHIVRLDSDGTHPLSLASGSFFLPTCSPDGKFVFYADLSSPQRIMRISVEGGTPVEIAKVPGDGLDGSLDISSDGKFVAFPWEQFTPAPAMHLSVISASEGRLVTSFKAPPGIYGIGCVRWSPHDSALQYLVTRDGVTNLWQQHLAGGPPEQLTKFTSGVIFWFNWSRNGKRLLLARGSLTGDAVLLSRFR
jgi:Tol biopolymer transport system component/DNA-binding winged helix-turn-helix (wHTH) protein